MRSNVNLHNMIVLMLHGDVTFAFQRVHLFEFFDLIKHFAAEIDQAHAIAHAIVHDLSDRIHLHTTRFASVTDVPETHGKGSTNVLEDLMLDVHRTKPEQLLGGCLRPLFFMLGQVISCLRISEWNKPLKSIDRLRLFVSAADVSCGRGIFEQQSCSYAILPVLRGCAQANIFREPKAAIQIGGI